MNEDEKSDLARSLHKLILEAVPRATFLAKYGGVLYTVKPKEKEGQFCGVFIHGDHVTLEFSQGARLKDPAGILQGRGHSRRHTRFYSAEEVPEETVSRLLKQAAKK